jgi:hypothetical protein
VTEASLKAEELRKKLVKSLKAQGPPPDVLAAMEAHGVVQPITVYVES